MRDLGGGSVSVLKTVILPGLRPAFLSCFVYNFSSSMTTAGAILFLIDPGRKLAVFKLLMRFIPETTPWLPDSHQHHPGGAGSGRHGLFNNMEGR